MIKLHKRHTSLSFHHFEICTKMSRIHCKLTENLLLFFFSSPTYMHSYLGRVQACMFSPTPVFLHCTDLQSGKWPVAVPSPLHMSQSTVEDCKQWVTATRVIGKQSWNEGRQVTQAAVTAGIIGLDNKLTSSSISTKKINAPWHSFSFITFGGWISIKANREIWRE